MKRKKASGGRQLTFSGGPFDGQPYLLPESWRDLKFLRLPIFIAKQNMATWEAARKTRRAQRKGKLDPEDYKAVFRDYMRRYQREMSKMPHTQAATEYRHEPESGRLVFVRYLSKDEYLTLREQDE
jgi:hypothetical protein